MRRMCRKLTCIIIAAVFMLMPLSAAAAELTADITDLPADMWHDDYYRCYDDMGELTELQEEQLDAMCLEFLAKYHADLSLFAAVPDSYEEMTLEQLSAQYYDECMFGYGPDRDGFQVTWDRESGETVILAFGNAENMIPRDYLDFTAGIMPKYETDYGVFGVLYVGGKMLADYLGGVSTEVAGGSAIALEEYEQPAEQTESEETTAPGADIPRYGTNGEKPAWYPLSTENFQFYHDENAPRIVDNADIFQPDEEERMEARLAEIRAEIDRDIVVFTDTSTYGLERMVYAADFYDFNGYGCGPEREGICLFVSMVPDDRGWWNCCTGPATKELFTEEIANEIDDLLYDYMVAGSYGEGVADWIENVRRMYVTGSPYLDDWAIQDINSFTRFHDPVAPRVIDEAGLLTDEEVSALTERASAVSVKYNTDVIVHTSRGTGNLSDDEYVKRFLMHGGYGYGDDYDALVLTIFKRPYVSCRAIVTAEGSAAEKLTEVNSKRMESRFSNSFSSDKNNYYEVAKSWLGQADHMLKTGRAPRSAVSWLLVTLAELAAGLIFAWICLLRARKKMETPEVKQNADAYLVRDSLIVRNVGDHLVDTTTTKHYDPIETRSSGSSGGSGRSSYSSSYSGSSGASHSGSGRNF